VKLKDTIMKLNNFNQVTLEALVSNGYSTVKALEQVNAELGKMNNVESESFLRNPIITKETKLKASTFKLTLSTKEKFESAPSIGLRFFTWSYKVAKLNMEFPIGEGQTYTMPIEFKNWLDKFARTAK